jgi:fatty-acyl-CoA synthase
MTLSPSAVLAYGRGELSEPILEQTIGDALRAAAALRGPCTALVEGTLAATRRRWSYDQLLAKAEQAARALLGRFSPGDRVAVWAGNCPEWVFLEFGAALAGITLVTVNPAYLGREAAYVLGKSRASGVIVQPVHRGRDLLENLSEVKEELPALGEVISLADWEFFLAAADPATPLPEVRPGDPAQIQYTSGTTGFPKGAQLTHRGLANNARLYAHTIGAGPADIWVNPMPLFHTAGCGLATLGPLQTGGTQILPPGFDPAAMLALFEAEHGTIMLSVPTMLNRMLNHPDAEVRNLSSWRLATLGGAPVPPELVRRAQKLGLKVGIGFGQTEASPYVTHTLPDDPHPDWVSTVGRPLPGVEVRVIDPRSRETVPRGTIGEICARGYGVMTGYFDDPEATAEVLDADGWLHTGDLGSMDARGYLWIEGRLKDMIIRGGENIYPREIEDLLYTHPGVLEVAVVGVPDSDLGEVVAAYVQARAGYQLDESELDAFCQSHLAAYKVPRVWRFVDHFPLTGSGKIQKFVLREQFLSQ